MSERMTCPACNSHTSSVLRAFAEGHDCPDCGLPADVAWTVTGHRQRKADEALTNQLAAVGKEVGALRRENRTLRRALMDVQNAMEGVEARPFSLEELDLSRD